MKGCEIIGPPKLDTLGKVQLVERPVVVNVHERSLWYVAKQINHDVYGFTEADLIADTHKATIYERAGYNLSEERSRHRLLDKGQACLHRTMWPKYLHWKRRNDEEGIPWYNNDIQIAIPFLAKSPDRPFADLIKGTHWIQRASIDAFLQPSLITKSSPESTAAYFKSMHFLIVAYSLKNKISDFERQLERIKSNPRKEERLTAAIWDYRRRYGNENVFRFEVRILGRSKCERFGGQFLDVYRTEEAWCREVLRQFYETHPAKHKEKKTDSRHLKQFFVQGG